MKRLIFSALSVALLASVTRAESKNYGITVVGGKEDLTNVLVTVALPDEFKGGAEFLTAENQSVAAQATSASVLSSNKTRELVFLVPHIRAGQTLKFSAKSESESVSRNPLKWHVVDGMEQLQQGDRPILRYFHKPFDASLTVKGKEETANPTTKPFHHLFAADGKTIVTNNNQGQYPHHRGIYFGFNNISYGEGKKADVWHCRKGEYTGHEEVLAADVGVLFARQTLQIGWHGQDGQIFANERRELTLYPIGNGTLIEWVSELKTPLDKVRLDGDPQHAGFHFRANSAMEKNTKETYFIRPDGKGKPGEEKNWVPKGKAGPVNLP